MRITRFGTGDFHTKMFEIEVNFSLTLSQLS